MGTTAHQLAIVQHQNLIGKPDGGRPLGYQEGCRRVFHLPDGHAQIGIRGIVQGGGAVVQNQDSGLAHQRTGNGQSLALTAGEVHASLLHRRIQLPFLILHHFPGLGGFQRRPQLVVGGIGIAPAQVLPDGALEQHRFLGNQPHGLAQGLRIIAVYLHPIQQHLPRQDVVQPGNQIHQGGLTRTGAADDADGLAGHGMEADVLQRGIGRAAVLGRHIPEFHLSLQAACIQSARLLVAFQLQNRRHPVGTGQGFGDGDNQVGHLDQLHQNLGHIVIQGNHQALGQDAVLNLNGPYPHQQHHCQVDDHVGQRIHQRRNPACGKLAGSEGFRLTAESVHLIRFLAESPQHPHAGQVLPGGGGHAVQRPLHPTVHGHGNQHQAEHNHAQHRNHAGEYQCSVKINGKGHEHGAEYHKRRAKQQPQCQVHTVLHLVHIRGHPGNHGGASQLVHLAVTQAQDVLHQSVAQPGGESHRRHRRKILGGNRHQQANHTQRHQHQAHLHYIAPVTVGNTLVHDSRHHQRDKQFKQRFQQLEQRSQNAFFFVAFQIPQELFQTTTSKNTGRLYHPFSGNATQIHPFSPCNSTTGQRKAETKWFRRPGSAGTRFFLLFSREKSRIIGKTPAWISFNSGWEGKRQIHLFDKPKHLSIAF